MTENDDTALSMKQCKTKINQKSTIIQVHVSGSFCCASSFHLHQNTKAAFSGNVNLNWLGPGMKSGKTTWNGTALTGFLSMTSVKIK